MHDLRTDAPPPRTALVVGAGIGGLTAAIALDRLGLDVRVLERHASLEPAGAGLTLWPNALAALQEVGLRGAVQAAAQPITSGAVLEPDGRVLSETPVAPIAAALGGPVLALHRADLHTVLRRALGDARVTTGVEVTGLLPERDEQAGVRTADGGEHRADVVVAADGISSPLRAALTGRDGAPRYGGATSWRGVADLPAAAGRATETWGAGLRFGLVGLPRGRTYWFATRTGPPAAAADALDVDGLRALFAGWHAPIDDVLAVTPAGAVIATDLEEVPRLAHWSRGRVALLGDAAHALTPNLGQGAAMAIEDGVLLARELGRGGRDVETALQAYTALRRPRVERIARESRRVGRIAQARSPLLVTARRWSARATPTGLTVRRLRGLLG